MGITAHDRLAHVGENIQNGRAHVGENIQNGMNCWGFENVFTLKLTHITIEMTFSQ